MEVLVATNNDYVPDEETLKQFAEMEKEPPRPEMKSLHVISNIRNRYARTVVTSKYVNSHTAAQETTFSIALPDTAFIAGFIMVIKEKEYVAYVKEKEEAKLEYELAVSQGKSAAHVAVSARDSNKFTVSANVEPQSDVTFILTYEELLVRKHGKYEMVVNLHPRQFVDNLSVDININESRPIINVVAPALRSGNEITNKVTKNELATISKDKDGIVHVAFHPTLEQQKEMAKILEDTNDIPDIDEEPSEKVKPEGISGQFVVEYDVERDPLGGEVLVNDGYFVHFFAPTELKPIPKHVIFVLDVSGSMCGRKLKQLREAMKVILDELNPKDYFNLVKFSDDASVLNSKYIWEAVKIPAESKLPHSFEVTEKNIKAVKDVIAQITDEGCTNIYDALIVGLRLTSKGISHLKQTDDKHKPQPIIVFLTDGQPNVTESQPKKIIEMVERRNDCDNKSAVFTLAFGDDADKEFLKELAIQNSGFLRNIYEASDASLQLHDFYKQISSPLLTNVNFKYSEQVKEITKHNFDILFNGSEFVVTGKVDEMIDDFVFVEASTLDGTNQFCPVITTYPKPELKAEYGSLERMWAYMTIKQLLDKKYEKKETDESSQSEENISKKGEQKDEKKNTEKEIAEKQALNLALKYSFVTPVTSLVVVKPDEPSIEDLEQDSCDGNISAKGQGQGVLCSLTSADASDYLNNYSDNSCLRSCAMQSCSFAPASQPRALLKMTRSTQKRSNKTMSLTRKIAQFFTGKSEDDEESELIFNRVGVECNVENHVATTTEKRIYFNKNSTVHETTFTFILPEKVVLTEFLLGIDDDFVEAKGLNKQEAKKEYKDAISNDLCTAFFHIEESNKITVKINVQPTTTEVTFMFKYKKCLEIKDGKYEVVTNIERESTTLEMEANVILKEDRLIKNVELGPLRCRNNVTKNEYAIINIINDNEVHINFNASQEEIDEIANALNVAFENCSWQFIVEYEVEPNASATEDKVTTLVALPFSYFVAVIKN